MIKSALTSIALFAAHIFYGQNLAIIDSLVQRLSEELSSKEIVDTYVHIAYEYSGLDSLKSQEYIDQAISLANQTGYLEGKADALYVVSRNSSLKGNYEQAEKDFETLMAFVNLIDYEEGKAKALFGLGWLSYYRGAYEQSLVYHKEALEKRKNLGIKIAESSSLRGLGITYKLLGDFEKALYYLNESLVIESELQNKVGIAECLNHMGIISGLRGDYPSALDAYFEALSIQEEIKDKKGLAYTYQNIGFVHYRQNAYAKTLDYYQKSLRLRQEIGETRGVAQITYYLGGVYHEQGQYERALSYYLDALQMKEELGDRRGVADGYLNIGRLFADQGDYQEAISYQSKSLDIFEEINSDWGKVNALIGLGRSHSLLKASRTANNYLNRGIALAKKAQLLESIREAAQLLAISEKEMGHFEDAYKAQVLFQQVSDSLSNEAVTKRITLLEAEYEFAQVKDSIQFANEKEKLVLDQKITAQRNVQLAYVIALIVLVLVLAILFRYYRLKINLNKRLSLLNNRINDHNESLKRLNNEKNNLINIVAHDLKSPLANIRSAAEVMGLAGKEEKQELKSIIHENTSRMERMIADILNVETIEKNVEELHVKPFNVSNTVVDISNQLSGQAAQKDIELQKRIEANLMGLVDERYIMQIVENLLSNAIKFSPPRKKVIIELTRIRENLILHIKDEGPGINKEDKQKLFQQFQRLSAKPTGNETSTGLGLSIVKQLVEKMEGRVWVESEEGKGASFFVELQAA